MINDEYHEKTIESSNVAVGGINGRLYGFRYMGVGVQGQ